LRTQRAISLSQGVSPPLRTFASPRLCVKNIHLNQQTEIGLVHGAPSEVWNI
jgi:hypothetical protein